MSLRIDIDLIHEWSITHKGEPHLDLVPKNRPNDVKASFTFDVWCFIDAIRADIENDDFDPDEWLDLIKFLRSTADDIEVLVKEELHDDN